MSDINKILQRKIALYIKRTLKGIKKEAADEFDKNFNRQAFFNKKWARRKYNDDTSRSLLVQNGSLRRSITADITDRESVLFQTKVAYANIHNEGGTITVTKRMKNYFWCRYQSIVGTKDGRFSSRLQRKKNGTLRNNKYNRKLNSEAEFYRAMALKKVGSKISIPKRQFIGNHPELEKLLKEIAEKNAIEIFN